MRDAKIKILRANAEYTGGGIYRYTAEVETTNEDEKGLTRWLLGNSEWNEIYLMSEDPDETEDSWYNEWCEDHTIKTYEDDEYYEVLRDMLSWIIKNRPAGNYALGEIEENLDYEMRVRKGDDYTEESTESGDRLVSMTEFVKIYNAALTLMFNDIGGADNVIYGKDLTIHWNGIYCNCGDGASVYNNIIAGIEGVISEEGGE